MSVIKIENLDINSLKFSPVMKNKSNGKTIYVNSADGGKVTVQLPFLKAPFGLNRFDESSQYDISLSIPKNTEVFNKFHQLDERVIDHLVKNSKESLGKIYNEQIIREALYRPVMRPPLDEKYDYLLKVKVSTNANGQPATETYDHTLNLADLTTLQKGQKVMTIATISSVWLIDGKAGISIRLEQAMLSKSEKLTGFAFLLDEETGAEDPNEPAYFD